jgi:cytochrome P450 family 110
MSTTVSQENRNTQAPGGETDEANRHVTARPAAPWRQRGLSSWPGRVGIAGRRLQGALGLALDPEGFLERQRQRYGETFWLWLPGVDPTLVTGNPDEAKQIYQRGVDAFDAPRGQPLEPVFGTHSIVLNSGETHRRQRGLVMPAFRRDRMVAFGDLMQEISWQVLGRLQAGQRCEVHTLAQVITLHIILRAIFGVTEPAQTAAMEAAVIRFLQTYTPPLMLLPTLRHRLLSLGQWTRFLRARDALDDLLDAQIELSRRTAEPGVDILSQLVHATDEEGQHLTNSELKDELRTMLVAGHDTTAATMAWALYFLHHQPERMQRLLDELQPLGPRPNPAALQTLPYLDAVCQEALRLHPPIQLSVRQLKEPMTLAGQTVLPSENVAVSLRLLHTSPEIWPDGAEFRPERFLERTFSPWEFAPFGGGGRRCVGAAFGTFELRVVLATLLTSARFESLGTSAPLARLRGIIVVPHNRVPLRYLGPR